MGISDADKVTAAYQKKSKFEVSLGILLCGGVAGQTFWVLFYPVDFLKTQLQTAKIGCTKSIFTLARETYR